MVTGGGSGIGLEIALALAENGASVVACDLDAPSLDAPGRREIPALRLVQADVASPSDVARLFDDVRGRLGGLDILVNNAVVAGPVGPVDGIDAQELDRMLEVNLQGQFHCAAAAAPLLRAAGGGSIVNMSSAAGRMGYPNRSSYSASKWGVIGLTRSLAIELGPANIRVNAVCPGAVEGEVMDRAITAIAANNGWPERDVRAHFEQQASLGVMVAPTDVAHLVVFLVSDLARRISGQVIGVDGDTTRLS